MLVLLLAFSTVLLAVWVLLLCMATREEWIAAAKSKVVDNQIAVQVLEQKERAGAARLAQHRGVALSVMRLFVGTDYQKEIGKLTAHSQRLQAGDLRGLNLFLMPGYVLQRRFTGIGRGGVYKTILTHCMELYGRKFAEAKTMGLLAALLSYPIAGLGITFSIAGVLFGLRQTNAAWIVLGFGSLLVLAASYALYDDVADKAKKRRETIARQFPNVVSKLALLVTSGMIMNNAWQQTADSQEGELYREMRKTADELQNLVSPEMAYSNFIGRCNTKETSKLAAAIMQSLSKGNTELGKLLRDLAKESWQERKHMAKRDSEKANAKLMIPTMLLFIAILVMIVVPIFISMNVGI